MRKTVLIGALGLGIAAVMAGGAVAYAEQLAQAADPITARKDNRKAAGAQMRAIKAVIDKGGPVSEIPPLVAKLQEAQKTHLTFYPSGSDKGETKALAIIWSDWAGFQAANKATDDAIVTLATAAAGTDLKAVTDAYGAVGRACGACHEKFRAK
jgi:cytochrome c556